MSASVRTASGVKEVANISVRTGAGLKGVANAYIRTALGLKRFFTTFAVSASPPNVNGVVNGSGATFITTKVTTVSVEGAVGAVSYAWTKLTGGAWSIANPGGAQTAFSITLSPGESDTGTFRCTVTDASGHSATVDVTGSATNRYGGIL